MLIIINGHVLTMENNDIVSGYVAVNNGKIHSVGSMSQIGELLDRADEIVDAGGKYVTPGMIDAHCHLGMFGDSLGFEGDDGNEDTDPITPQLRAIDAINPRDRGFSEALAAGVTTVVTGPGSANVIGGQYAAIKTFGQRIDDMVIKSPVAMKIAFGENPKTVYHGKNLAPVTRMASASLIRESLIKAKRYLDELQLYQQDSEESEKPEFDFKLESLLPVMRGEIPLKAHAHQCDDIFTAIRIAKEFGLKLTLEHCTEGHLIAKDLAREGYAVNVGPSLSDRSKPELRNLTFETPAALSQAGLSVAIVTDHPVVPIQYLPLCAILAVKSGMDRTAALMAITANAAKNVGIADRVGSLSVNKDADIVIFDLHPLDVFAKAVTVIVDGKIVFNNL